jgi:hypothetical protein
MEILRAIKVLIRVRVPMTTTRKGPMSLSIHIHKDVTEKIKNKMYEKGFCDVSGLIEERT